MKLSSLQLSRFCAELAAAPQRWRYLVSYDNDARVYERIWDEDDVNAWVICWSEGQDTGFHDHDDAAAAIVVVDGHVREERLRLGASPSARLFGPGATFLVPPTAIHRVRHSGSGPAVTIHAYSPPLRRTGAYRVGPGGELERVAQTYEQELRMQSAAAVASV